MLDEQTFFDVNILLQELYSFFEIIYNRLKYVIDFYTKDWCNEK